MPSNKSSPPDSVAPRPIRTRKAAGVQKRLDWDPVGLLAGVDEAGRGPLAGPVVAAAVILDDTKRIRGLADSKVLTARARERLYHAIRAKAPRGRSGIAGKAAMSRLVSAGRTRSGRRSSISSMLRNSSRWAASE